MALLDFGDGRDTKWASSGDFMLGIVKAYLFYLPFRTFWPKYYSLTDH